MDDDNDYDSNLRNYNTEIINKLGKLPEKTLKIYHNISKNLILKNFVKRENISSKYFREVFEEYISPKHVVDIGKEDEDGQQELQKQNELIRTKDTPSDLKQSSPVHDINRQKNGFSKLKEIRKNILKNSLDTNDFRNKRSLNIDQITFEYLDDIFENLYKEEMKIFTITQLSNIVQTDINEKMRATIVDWLIQVHHRFKLHSETLFLAIHLMDKYLIFKYIKRNKLQIVGITCLLIACKFEEILSPEIRDFVCLLDKQCELEDIIDTELEILKTLNFDVGIPSMLRFYDILAISFDFCYESYLFGKYLLELSLYLWKKRNNLNCLIASSVCYMVIVVLYGNDSEFNEKLCRFYSLINFKSVEIEDCTMEICFVLDNIGNSTYQSVRKKYLSGDFLEVAKLFP